MSWTPSAKGGYTIYAVATDSGGKTSTSAYVGVVPGAVSSVANLEATDDAALKGRTSDRNQVNNYGAVELYTREPHATEGEQSIVSVFKFDASSLASKAEIREAKLRLYVSDAKQAAADFAVWSTSGATSWVEESVTWNNGPTKKNKLSVTRVTAENRWYEWDVTNYVDDAVKAGVGLASMTFWLEGDEWTGQSFGISTDSHKRSNHPTLRVTSSDTQVPTTTAPAPSTSCPSSSTTPAGPNPTPAPVPAPPPAAGGGSGVVGSKTTSSFTVDHDASLQQANPDAFGNWGEVEARAKPNAAIVGIFKFNATTLVPSGTSREDVLVSSAKLRLYVKTNEPGNIAARFAVWSVEGSADWDETTVTWNNGPTKKTKLTTVTVDGTGKWVDFDVTAHIRALVTGEGETADLSKVTLWLQGDAGDWERLECHSNREGNANPAKLEVVSSIRPPPPPPRSDKSLMPPPYLGTGGTTNNNNTTVTSDAAFSLHGFMRSPGNTIALALVVSFFCTLLRNY